MDLTKVTRIEVIDKNGKQYVNWHCEEVVASLQDNDRTLKFFIDDRDKKKKELYFCVGCRQVHYDENCNEPEGDLKITNQEMFLKSVTEHLGVRE